MRILNVIKIKNGVVDDMESFPIVDEQLSEETIEAAEKMFIESAKELGFVEEEEDCICNRDAIIDDGYFQIMNASVCLHWSCIDSV